LSGFVAANYVGAFDPNTATPNWLDGWTNFNLGVTGSTTTSMLAGWNLVSVPRVPSTNDPTLLWPGAAPGTIYQYDGTNYTNPTSAVAGPGYWALYNAAASNTISGTGLGANAVNIPATLASGSFRWILVGSVTSAAVPTSLSHSITSGFNPIQPGTLFGYDGSSYVTPTSIEPGKAYWVLVAGNGTSYFVGFAQ
jgi:hypothetical protein